MYKSKYNDLDLVYDKDIYQKLRDNDVDDLLARHIAHLFIRDPLVIFKELLDQDDEKSMDHFEVCVAYLYTRMDMTTQEGCIRISNPPIGRLFVSSPHHQTLILDGVLNSAAWKYSLLILRMLPFLCLLFWSLG